MKENIGGGYAMVIDNERENAAYSLFLLKFEALVTQSTNTRNLDSDKHPL